MLDNMISPSRTYVVLVQMVLGDGPEFKKFALPEEYSPNDSDFATWVYLNKLDLTSMVYCCMPFEVYSKISDVKSTF